MSKSRGIKSPNGRRPKKLSSHAEDDKARRRSRLNITISDQSRKLLGELGPVKTSLGVVGQTSNNIEAGVKLLHFLTHGNGVDEVAFSLVEVTGEVSRHKQDGSAYTRMSSLSTYLDALAKSVRKVVSSRGEALGDGAIKLTKPNA